MSERSPQQPREPSRWRPIAKAVLQVLGFIIGVALLAWCVHSALKNPDGFRKLREATAGQIAALAGLSAIVVLASGEVFRQTVRPIKTIPFLPAQATNVIACLLVLVPFKLSVFFRIFVHNRRDHIPLLTIGAWFASVAVVILCVLGPILGATAIRGRADTLWFVIAVGGMLACLIGLWLVARTFATERGWAWAKGVYARLPLPVRLRPGSVAGTLILEKGHEGVRMLASPRVVFGCAFLRLIDFAAQAARISIAASIVGLPLEWDRALLAGAVFFLITAAAPSGALGAREGGTTGIIGVVLAGINRDDFAVAVLTVSAIEIMVLLVGSMIGLAYLRPDRLLRLGHKPTTA
jgi:hypothetical protein